MANNSLGTVADPKATSGTGDWTAIALLKAILDAGGVGGGGGVPAEITTPTHTAPPAGAASGALLAANANRIYALLINDSDTNVYIKLGAAAVLNQGIRLNANGGSYEMSLELGNLYRGAVNGIAASGSGKVVLVTEGV